MTVQKTLMFCFVANTTTQIGYSFVRNAYLLLKNNTQIMFMEEHGKQKKTNGSFRPRRG